MKILVGLAVATFFVLFVLFGLDRISKNEAYQFWGELTSEVQTSSKGIALTFDDGPTKGKTEKILEILARENVKATFYLVGEAIKENPEQTKMIINSGPVYTNRRLPVVTVKAPI